MGAIQEVAQLRLALESLEDDIDLDLDLDGDLGDKLDELGEAMDNLTDSFNSDLNDTIDRLEGLEFDDITVRDGNGDSGGDTGSDSGDYIPSAKQFFDGGVYDDDNDNNSPLRQSLEKFHNNVDGIRDAFDVADGISAGEKRMDFRQALGEPTKSFTKDDADGIQDKINSVYTQDDFQFDVNRSASKREGELYGDTNMGLQSFDAYKQKRGIEGSLSVGANYPGGNDKKGIFQKLPGSIEGIGDGVRGMKKSFKKLIPSMSTWINMVGMAVPALGAMAVQAAGVAAAMGSMALAGAGIIGLGLIGHGDSMAESMRNAGKQVDELKKGLFEAVEPTADLFSQTQAEFFDFVPGEVKRIARSMEGLLVFEDDIFSLFTGMTEFVADFFNLITSKADTISDLTSTFSKLIGQSILDFFGWLLEAADKNQKMLINLGASAKTFAIAMYNVFVAVSRAVVMLRPFFGVLSFIANLMNNSLVSGMLAVAAVLYMVSTAVVGLSGAFFTLGMTMLSSLGPAISAITMALSSYIGGALVAIGVNASLAASIGLVTSAVLGLAAVSGIGLLVSGAGLLASDMMKPDSASGSFGGSGSGRGGSQTIINEGDTVNVDIGNADTATMEKFSDMRGGSGSRGPVDGSYTS
jgi:hypothetical protein